MHLSDGLINVGTCAAGYALATGLNAIALKKTSQEDIPRVSLMGAAFFVTSLIHIKVGITSVHLTLAGLTGIILGWSAPLAFTTGLLFQWLMFAHGGITTVGLNIVVFSVPALLTHECFRLCLKVNFSRWLLSMAGGILSAGTLIGAALLVFIIILSQGDSFMPLAAVFSISNLILAGVEGLLSGLIIHQLLVIRPELIYHGKL